MRKLTTWLLSVALPALTLAWADDKTATEAKKEQEEKATQLRMTAQANWANVEAGPVALHETKNLIVLAPQAMEKRLKELGTLLERGHALALGALAFDNKLEASPGRIVVYLFPGKDPFRAFVRRVERRRLEGEEVGSYAATDDDLHAAASPPRSSVDLTLEGQAVAQVAAVLLARKARVKVPVADWLVQGFGRATWYRLAPRDKVTFDDRRNAARLSGQRSAKEIYGGLIEASEADCLRGSLADYLAYGPYARRLPALLKGFEPDENAERKTSEQALEAAAISWERLDKGWKAWALSPR